MSSVGHGTGGCCAVKPWDLYSIPPPLSEFVRAPLRYKSFHEKAGMSQVGFVFLILSSRCVSNRSASAAILPSALFYERLFARCQLGVLVSAGAAT